MRHYPDLKGTVTDLLIGDLFTDCVDKVWKPMDSLRPPDHPPIAPWNACAPADAVENKANELFLPEGHKP